MLFTSLEFLLIFLPCTLLLHLILPHRAKNVWLLFASLLFYAWGEPAFLSVMLFSILFNYVAALLVFRRGRARRGILSLAIVGNLSLLFVFKYANFLTATLYPLLPRTAIPLPLGISFFTFQAMSYVIDVSRGTPAQKNPLAVGLYISLFPQLIAGPIVRYTDVAREIETRRVSWERAEEGILRFLRGFNKKVLLANTLATVADAAFSDGAIGAGLAWLGVIAYALQIYYDFSGYSEMAIGLGALFGFSFPENFNDPYLSETVSEFWRRWHMTLGTWFRDYLYFPMGGSRVSSRWRLALNLGVVWLCTGLWHGADWSFLLWGAWYGLWICAEKLLRIPAYLARHARARPFYRAITLFVILFGWILFRAEGICAVGNYLLSMLGIGTGEERGGFYLREYLIPLLIGVLFAMPWGVSLRSHLQSRRWSHGAAVAVQVLLFFVSISFAVMDAHDPFIYFNF